jgi:DNA primase
LVITEDYLSAIAVTRVGFTALALLTTQPSQEALRIAQAARNVIIWLDPDHAGESGAIRTMQTLANVAQIIRKDEPKAIPLKQVSNILRFLR